MAEGGKGLFLYGHRETAGGIPIPATVMAMRIAYLLYRFLVLLKEVINLGI